ncbi:hypothetical protein J6590_061054 [Homalodisca vitripennis]|nr:hypothetical protein J6590_061054 [Homalodisca vitripennis]
MEVVIKASPTDEAKFAKSGLQRVLVKFQSFLSEIPQEDCSIHIEMVGVNNSPAGVTGRTAAAVARRDEVIEDRMTTIQTSKRSKMHRRRRLITQSLLQRDPTTETLLHVHLFGHCTKHFIVGFPPTGKEVVEEESISKIGVPKMKP